MRFPLMPSDSDAKVYIHVGVNPKFSMNGGTLYYRAFGDMNWSTSDYFYSHDNVGQNNDYWVAELNNTMFMAGDTVEYFAMTTGDAYADTYVYWDGNASMTTGDMTMAATNPFSYALEMATPTPTPTDGPTMTPTPQPSLMTAWHIPDALEGLNGDTMRYPLMPSDSDAKVYVHVGVNPKFSMNGGTLYYRASGDMNWSTSDYFYSHDNVGQNNDYWVAELNNTMFIAGDTVEYFAMTTGDSYADTYVYWDGNASMTTGDMAMAATNPFSYDLEMATPTPTPTDGPTMTPTPQPGLMTAWHIPDALEGLNGDTMRYPLMPTDSDAKVYIHVGVNPKFSMNGGTLYYRASGDMNWSTSDYFYSHDNVGQNNDYWVAELNNTMFMAGDTVEYFAMTTGDSFADTFVYWDGNASMTTGDMAMAATNPFSYDLEMATPTPTPTDGPTMTPTPQPSLMTAWHIPDALEGLNGDTMRFPLMPTDSDAKVYIHVGVNPKFSMNGGTLYYRASGDMNWSTSDYFYSHDNVGQNNDYWVAELNNTMFMTGDTVEYFAMTTGDSYADTFVYWDGNASMTTGDMTMAATNPFSYDLEMATPTPTPTDGPTMTPTPQPSLMTAWHIPDALEGLNGDTMRYPLMPTDSTDKVYIHVGVNPKFSMNGGTLYYRASGDMNWSMSDYFYSHDNVGQNNDYWVAELNNTMFMAGDTVEYFAMTTGDAYADTYVYWDGNASMTTGDMMMAATNPFSYALEMATPTPTPTDGPTMTPTPQPSLMTAWHIPDALEGLNGDTMRFPLMPTDSTDKVYVHVGVNPKFSMNGGTLYYRASGDMNWSTSDYFYSHDNAGQNNDYWVAELNNTLFMAGDTVEYFAMTTGDAYADTYVYWDGNASMTTGDMMMAATNPFSYALEMATPTPTPTITPTPSGNLMNAWHIPDFPEGLNGTNMREPLNPTTSNDLVKITIGVNPKLTMDGGELLYRKEGAPAWTSKVLLYSHDNVAQNNDYWFADINMSGYTQGDTVEYYLKATSNTGFDTTFVHMDANNSVTTGNEGQAQASPFMFTIDAVQPTPTPVASLMNVWHIPTSLEGFGGGTMRYPLEPLFTDDVVYIHLGVNPKMDMSGGTLHYRVDFQGSWYTSEFRFSYDDPQRNNDYWVADINNAGVRCSHFGGLLH